MEYLEFKGISRTEFYEKTEIKRGLLDKDKLEATISDIFLAKIIAVFKDLCVEWLITGRGEMLKSSNLENDIEIIKVNSKPGIPLVEQLAIAGFGSANFSISERDVKDYYIIPKFKYLKIDFMIEICGSSMYPKYNSGDIVACTIIRESKFIQWNKCHVIATREQGLLVKRIKKGDTRETILAVSDNLDYDPFIIPLSEVTGIALVVGVIRLE